jgi:DNA-binding SARP family transcriptional activator
MPHPRILLLQSDPLRDDTYRHLMRFHVANGYCSGSLQVYHTCATLFQGELGVELGREREWRELQRAWRTQLPINR